MQETTSEGTGPAYVISNYIHASSAEILQCDLARPNCKLCRKSCRNCHWESNETGLPFRSENAFARGERRRPRTQLVNTSQHHPAALTTPHPSASSFTSISIETQALNYWVFHFAAWPSNLADIDRGYEAYVLDQRNRAQPDSSLHLALLAYALATFGRNKSIPKALEIAHKFYSRSIATTQHEINELSNRNIDQLMIATLLLTSYEVCSCSEKVYPALIVLKNTVCEVKQHLVGKQTLAADATGTQVWGQMCHLRGAEALLRFRQRQGFSQNLVLERAVRRPLVSQRVTVRIHRLF